MFTTFALAALASPIAMKELGNYDISTSETTPMVWHGELLIVEKIGANPIILPGDKRIPRGSYFRIRKQALLGHGSNEVVVPVVPGSVFKSFANSYIDDRNASHPTMWVFGTSDCHGWDKPTGCAFNNSAPGIQRPWGIQHPWMPCVCPPDSQGHSTGIARGEVWAMWSSDPLLRAESWQSKLVLTLPPQVPVCNVDVTRGPSGQHVMTLEQIWEGRYGGQGYYNIFATTGSDPSSGWHLLDTETYRYWGADHGHGHLYDYGDPTIRYIPSDGYYYLVPATPMQDGRPVVPPGPYPCCFVQWVARSKDLATWEDAPGQNARPFMGWPGPHAGPGPQGAGDRTVQPGSVLDVYGTAEMKEKCANKTDDINRSDGDWVELPASFTAKLGLVGPAVYVVWLVGDQMVLSFGGAGLVNASQERWLQSYFE